MRCKQLMKFGIPFCSINAYASYEAVVEALCMHLDAVTASNFLLGWLITGSKGISGYFEVNKQRLLIIVELVVT